MKGFSCKVYKNAIAFLLVLFGTTYASHVLAAQNTTYKIENPDILKTKQDSMAKDLDLNDILKSGNLVKIKDYLTERYYRYGAIYPLAQMLERGTGKKLDSSYFDNYLKDKYRRLFG